MMQQLKWWNFCNEYLVKYKILLLFFSYLIVLPYPPFYPYQLGWGEFVPVNFCFKLSLPTLFICVFVFLSLLHRIFFLLMHLFLFLFLFPFHIIFVIRLHLFIFLYLVHIIFVLLFHFSLFILLSVFYKTLIYLNIFLFLILSEHDPNNSMHLALYSSHFHIFAVKLWNDKQKNN